jgi:hypothetical protein
MESDQQVSQLCFLLQFLQETLEKHVRQRHPAFLAVDTTAHCMWLLHITTHTIIRAHTRGRSRYGLHACFEQVSSVHAQRPYLGSLNSGSGSSISLSAAGASVDPSR